MNRELQHEDLIELGVVSDDTKGHARGFDDEEFGERILPGLTRD
jgi:hypothetical protein